MQSTIWVGRVKSTCSPNVLKDHFSKIGKLVKVETGFAGFAFVEFEEPDDATKAVDELNKTTVPGVGEILVSKASRKGYEDAWSKREEYWRSRGAAPRGGGGGGRPRNSRSISRRRVRGSRSPSRRRSRSRSGRMSRSASRPVRGSPSVRRTTPSPRRSWSRHNRVRSETRSRTLRRPRWRDFRRRGSRSCSARRAQGQPSCSPLGRSGEARRRRRSGRGSRGEHPEEAELPSRRAGGSAARGEAPVSRRAPAEHDEPERQPAREPRAEKDGDGAEERIVEWAEGENGIVACTDDAVEAPGMLSPLERGSAMSFFDGTDVCDLLLESAASVRACDTVPSQLPGFPQGFRGLAAEGAVPLLAILAGFVCGRGEVGEAGDGAGRIAESRQKLMIDASGRRVMCKSLLVDGKILCSEEEEL